MSTQVSLSQFVNSTMKLTGIYQPVILRRLLLDGGKSSFNSIAQDCYAYDNSKSVAYYESKLGIYPKQVLKAHNVALTDGKQFLLVASVDNAEAIIKVLESKLHFFLSK